MKFGKRCEQLFRATGISESQIPSIPYRDLKRALHHNRFVSTCKFFEIVVHAIRVSDAAWVRTIQRIQICNVIVCSNAHLIAALVAWADVAKESLRKLLKKYNRRYAQTHGPVIEAARDVRFLHSFTLLRLHHMMQMISLPPYPHHELAKGDTKECPICFSSLTDETVHTHCGHLFCFKCFRKVHEVCRASVLKRVPTCPVCREILILKWPTKIRSCIGC